MSRQSEAAAGVTVVRPMTAHTPNKATTGPVKVRTLYGRMIDPFTNVCYTQEPQEVSSISDWVRCQISADKMEVVEA